MRRFWTEVEFGADRVVRLDGRPVRTPGRVPLALPTRVLAEAVAREWRSVGETLDPRTMPLTGLANAAIDRVDPDRAAFAAGLARYGDSDLLCYRAEMPVPLVERQRAAWDALLAWARDRYDVHFTVTTGVIHRAQPAATLARLGEALAARDAFTLAGLSPVVTITGSLVAALALDERAFGADVVWHATEIDEAWQREMWGDDPLGAAARDERRRDFDAAVTFLKALQMVDADPTPAAASG